MRLKLKTVKKEDNMYKTRIEKDHFDENGSLISSRIIIEVPLPLEMIHDCYLFSAMDAPSEIKRMLMECLGDTIDEIILGKRPDNVDEQWLRRKLIEVKVI
jgi:hypothetical protein